MDGPWPRGLKYPNVQQTDSVHCKKEIPYRKIPKYSMMTTPIQLISSGLKSFGSLVVMHGVTVGVRWVRDAQSLRGRYYWYMGTCTAHWSQATVGVRGMVFMGMGREEHCFAGGGGGWHGSPLAQPPPSLVAVPGGGVRAGGALPTMPGGGGLTPTYMAQNEPHVALIILTTNNGGGGSWKKLFGPKLYCLQQGTSKRGVGQEGSLRRDEVVP